jgi:hypothetical protein
MAMMKGTRRGRPRDGGQRHHTSTPEAVVLIGDALTTMREEPTTGGNAFGKSSTLRLHKRCLSALMSEATPAKHPRGSFQWWRADTGGTLNLKRSR